MSTQEIDWQALSAPFDPADVDFRPQMGKADGAGARVQAVCYIDARVVADRLDDVVGPSHWSFHYEPLVIERGEIQLAKGALTIHGVTKEDVGDGTTFATSKGCVSDALKRAAVLWGIGRYLYSQPTEWVTLDQHKRIPEQVVAQLRAKLPRRAGMQPAPTPPPQQSTFAARPPVLHTPADKPASPEMTSQQFLAEISKIGVTPQQAAQALGVKSFSGLNLALALETLKRSEPASGVAPVPAEMARAAREAAAAATATKEPFRTATPTQWDTIRRGCAALGQEPPDPPISFEEAGALIGKLSEEYKRQASERQKAGAKA